jgi:HAE1 family hydrophobic/amphiphilic exporter-1
VVSLAAEAQTFPTPKYFERQFTAPTAPSQIPDAEGLQPHIVEGKLRLSLDDAIRLTLANNTEVRINQLQYEASAFSLLRAYQPFDPLFVSSFRPTRTTSPTTSTLQGAPTLSDLTQQTSMSYTQIFQTGTSYSVGFNTSRNTTNSTFALFNPSYFSSLNLSVTQPLLRRRGLLPNRAPITIARRNVQQSLANFQAQVNDAIARAVNQYWDVVQSRKDLEVLRKSLELAEATYKQNKRALELGALPPLDIYRSESQVAQRRLAVIQAEYRLKQLEDDFRRTIGADLDLQVAALDLDLTEKSESDAPLSIVDLREALARALGRRPELESVRQQLANTDTNIQVANNNMKPDLNLTGFYSSSGRGGTSATEIGGFRDSVSQLSTFDFPTYGVNLELRLPIRNRAAEADLGNAMLTKRRNLYELRQREQAIALEVKNAVNQLEQSRLSVSAAQIALDLARKNLAAEERKYELGVQTIFFVLDAQTQLAQAEQSLLQAHISYQRAVTALERSTGGLLEKYRVNIETAVK